MNIILKEIRKVHDLTQSQLAEMLAVSRSAIAQIESGKNQISLDLAKKIANLFSVPIEKILNQDANIAWDIIKSADNPDNIWKSYYGETAMILEELDRIEHIKLLISKIAKEKKLKVITRRFDRFCKEHDFYNIKNEFEEMNNKNYDDKKMKKMFNLVDLGIRAIHDDLSSMLIFEYRILDEAYKED